MTNINTANELINSGKIDLNKFAKSFLLQYLECGFSDMTKRGVDILVYNSISENSSVFCDMSYYDIEEMLHIKASRFKAIQLEAYLRYQNKKYIDIIKDIQFRVSKREITPEIKNGWILFMLENPIDRRAFEYAVKESGNVIDYSYHKEIMRLNIATFINKFDDHDGSVKQKLKSLTKEQRNLIQDLNKQDIKDLISSPSKVISTLSAIMQLLQLYAVQ